MLLFTDTILSVVYILLTPFVLPIRIWTNSVKRVSQMVYRDEKVKTDLELEFPVLQFLSDFYDILIVLSFPVGIIISFFISYSTNYPFNHFLFYLSLTITFFSPIIFNLTRELLNISLKTVDYLGRISKK